MPFESRYNSLKGIISVIASFTITGVLTLTGATITGALLPTTSDGAAIGSATKMWSDLFLASGGVINWNNGNMTVTHAADTLTTAGGNITINDTGANPVLTVKRVGGYSPLRFYSTGDDTHNEGNYDIYAYGTGGSQDIIFEPANWGATVQFRGNSGLGVWQGVKLTMENAAAEAKGNGVVEVFNNDAATITLNGDTGLIDTTGSLDLGASKVLSFNGVEILSDSSGTTSLKNVDVIDATTSATISMAAGPRVIYSQDCSFGAGTTSGFGDWTTSVGGSGAFQFNAGACDANTGSTGTSYVDTYAQSVNNTGKSELFLRDFLWSASVQIDVGATDGVEAFVGVGDLATNGTAITYTDHHVGFVFKRESGTINVYYSQGNAAQTTALLTSISDTDYVELFMRYEVGVGTTYYYAVNGAAFSAGVQATANMPSTTDNMNQTVQIAVTNATVADSMRFKLFQVDMIRY